VSGQQPFAVILGCADSRVPPEIAFDTGLGELFVVRVAGNVANTSSIASIEYALVNLGTKLVVVLAHMNCGAVDAALSGAIVGPNLNHLFSFIRPALEICDLADVDTVARLNAKVSAARLASASEIIRNAVKEGGVRIVTAFYHLDSGVVEFDQTDIESLV
jgi:carbonic anhydrase